MDGVTPLDKKHRNHIKVDPPKVSAIASGSHALPSAMAAARKAAHVDTENPAADSADRTARVGDRGSPLRQAAGTTSAPTAVAPAAPSKAVTPASTLNGRLLDLTEPSHFKLPDAWIDAGQSLQAPGGGAGRTLSVYVGVDFGTAYTKLAIRFADKVFAVDWAGLSRAPGPFFLPGEVSRMSNGMILIGRAPHARETWSGIKQPFLTPEPSVAAQFTATAFLSWACRYARAWLFKHYGGMLRDRKLAWNLAVGCPTEAIEDKALVRTYLHVASAAWLLSRSPKPFDIDTAARSLEVAKPDPEAVQLDSLGVVPEFVAQIAGYARSSQRQPGLHFLADVGAGTLDLATFNVERDKNEEHRDHFPILERSVELLGTHFLMERRTAACSGTLRWADANLVPSTESICRAIPVSAAALQAADEGFTTDVRTRIRRVISLTKGKRSPLSPAWQHGLPVFLAGGGANCKIYRDALLHACGDCNVRPLLLPLQVSDEVDSSSVTPGDRHRLSVAYGLTSDASLLARITASKDIPDLFLFSRGAERPTRDDLYPK